MTSFLVKCSASSSAQLSFRSRCSQFTIFPKEPMLFPEKYKLTGRCGAQTERSYLLTPKTATKD